MDCSRAKNTRYGFESRVIALKLLDASYNNLNRNPGNTSGGSFCRLLTPVKSRSRPFDLQGIPTQHEVSALATRGLADNIRPRNYATLNGAD
jgi:hypothetical protein